MLGSGTVHGTEGEAEASPFPSFALRTHFLCFFSSLSVCLVFSSSFFYFCSDDKSLEGIYVPELIFGHLLTSSNYDDDEKKTTGGRNGYGAKLANIFR